MRIGWVGLGAMGGPLAARVARVRPPLSTFDIATAKMQQHAAESGSVPTASLAELGRNSDVVFLSLPTTNEVRTVIEQLVPTLRKNAIIVDCTSGNPVTSADVARLLPCAYIDLPVSGGPAGAAAGTVTAMAGGDAAAVERVRDIVSCFAKSIVHQGPIGSGHAVKAVNNLLNVGHLMLAGEGLLALRGFGVEPATALAAINGSSGRSLQTQVRLPTEVLTGQFGYGFELGLMLKDVRNATAIAGAHFPQATLLPAVEAAVAAATERVGRTADYTEAVRYLEELAGRDLRCAAPAPPPPMLYAETQLLVCDMAGTTVDEGGLVYIVLRESMNAAGLEVSEADMHPWHGAAKEEVVAHFAAKQRGADFAPSALAELTTVINKRFEKSLEEAYLAPGSGLSLIDPSLPDYFASLRARGCKVGLNTGYPRRLQQAIVDRLKLNEIVDGYISAQDVPRGRPSPYMVHALMAKLGVEDVSKVAKAGDTERDIGEALNAGCRQAIGVLSGADSEAALRASGATVIVQNITKLKMAS